MIRIGLIGEDPNDTKSIRNLLEQAYKGKARFIPLLKNLNGCHLDTEKFARMLSAELRTDKKDIYVFIRDADGIATEAGKLEARRAWYQKHSKNIPQRHLLLLNIYELEALIFADIESFNRRYHTAIKFSGDVTMIKEPKEALKEKTGRTFHESHCPDIFAQLNLETVQRRCGFFSDFVLELKTLVDTT